MSGQIRFFDEKQRIVDEYAERTKIYEAHSPFNFDLRGYKKYLEVNNISNDKITEEIALQFMN